MSQHYEKYQRQLQEIFPSSQKYSTKHSKFSEASFFLTKEAVRSGEVESSLQFLLMLLIFLMCNHCHKAIYRRNISINLSTTSTHREIFSMNSSNYTDSTKNLSECSGRQLYFWRGIMFTCGTVDFISHIEYLSVVLQNGA